MNIYAAFYSEEHSSILDFTQRYGKQLIWIAFAFILAVIVLLSNGRIYSVFAYFIYGLVILLLVSTLVFGKVVNASKSWIPIGSFGIQPAEFAKFATALALARLMSPYEFKLNTFWSYLKVGLIIAIHAVFILLQNDNGTALVFGSFVLVLFRRVYHGGCWGCFLCWLCFLFQPWYSAHLP
jgi:rod shape determining protein RodA